MKMMKFKTYICSFAAALLALGGCAKEKLDPSQQEKPAAPAPEGYVRLDLASATKTELEGAAVKWRSGDNIIVNGMSYPVSIDMTSGKAFVNVVEAASYDAFFPAEAWSDAGPLVQPVQFHAAGSFGAKADYLHAASAGRTLEFSHLCGILKLTVTGSGSVASISLKDNAGGSLCGKYEIRNGSLVESGSPQFDAVTLNCKTSANKGVDLSTSGTAFHIVLPARTYSAGLNVTIELVDGHSMVLESSTPRTITAGQVLTTPTIAFSYPSDQIYSYHLDNLAWGGDPVGGSIGFKTAQQPDTTGFEYCNALTATAGEPGTGNITRTSDSNGVFELGKSYAYSRNIQSFKKVLRVQECHGYLGCGLGGQKKASFKFPALTNAGSGIFYVEYRWKMAFDTKHLPQWGVQLFHTTSTTGKVMELWVDNVLYTASYAGSHWLSGAGSDGAPVLKDATNTMERALVKPSDFGDGKWHDVRLVMSAATKETVLEFSPFGSDSDQPFYIDEVYARRFDYPCGISSLTIKEPSTTSYAWSDNFALQPSWIISPASSTTMTNLSYVAKPYGIKYIDLTTSASMLFSTLKVNALTDEGWAYADSKLAAYKKQLDDMGVKVWSIHLPYTKYKEGYVADDWSFEFCCVDEAKRVEAVNRTKSIMKHLAVLEPVYYMVHTTQHQYVDFDAREYSSSDRQYHYYRDAGAKSFRELVAYAASDDCRYKNGSHGHFTIENLANTSSKSSYIATRAEYLNWFCAQAPGLGVCFDASHAVVNNINDPAAMITALGNNLKHVHMHGNNKLNDKDMHLFPGYRPGLFTHKTYNTTDSIDWGAVYAALIAAGYRGPFTYEYSSPEYSGDFRDCIANFYNIQHNYLGFILTEYKKQQ